MKKQHHSNNAERIVELQQRLRIIKAQLYNIELEYARATRLLDSCRKLSMNLAQDRVKYNNELVELLLSEIDIKK